MTEKPIFDKIDGVAGRGSLEKHEDGDRALSIIGGERVTVTAEEVIRDSHL